MRQTNTLFFLDAHHQPAQSSHYPLDPSINFTPQFLKDNTHMWQRRRSPADHCYCAPLTPPYPSEIRESRRREEARSDTPLRPPTNPSSKPSEANMITPIPIKQVIKKIIIKKKKKKRIKEYA
jgi:hypothetical protein